MDHPGKQNHIQTMGAKNKSFVKTLHLRFLLNSFRYNCNRYDEDEARMAREGQEKSRSALQRYLFYCNRYMNHLQSLKFENKLYSMVKVSV